MNSSQARAYFHGYTRAIIDRTPFYYGWIVMLVGTVGMIMTSPGQTYAISIFIDYFITDLGISRGMVSTLYAVGTLTAAMALPWVGRQIDKQALRFVVATIAALFGLACIYMGAVQNAAMLLVGFILLRMLGQGSLSLASVYFINQWWMRRRGTVLGISGVMVAILGLGTFPNIINWLIPLLGWRWTYVALGVALLVIMVPAGLFLFGERPERYGLKPDGKVTESDTDAGVVESDPEENWTASEAMHTSVFWIVAAGIASISMLGTGLTFHMVSIFSDNGLSATAAAAVYVPIAIASAVVNLGSGMLADRMPIRLLLTAALLLQTAALWVAQGISGVELAIVYGIVMGSMMGLMRTVSSVAWPSYFGRLYLGSITGITATISVAASALGPMPMGIARDIFGSYDMALSVLSLLPLSLAVLSLFMKRPHKAQTSALVSSL